MAAVALHRQDQTEHQAVTVATEAMEPLHLLVGPQLHIPEVAAVVLVYLLLLTVLEALGAELTGAELTRGPKTLVVEAEDRWLAVVVV